MLTIRELLAAGRLENRYLQAVAVLVAAVVVAYLADLLMSRVVRRWAARSRSTSDDRLVEAIHGPVRTTVLLVGLGLATQLLELREPFQRYTLSVLKTVAVVVWVVFGARFVSLILAALSRRQDRLALIDARTLPLFDNLAKVVLAGGAVYFVFLSWNIDVTAWLASAGIIGIAVGFAAKDTLANLFAGLFISADAPYKVGDFIVLDGGERGRVTNVGIRSTRILTRDDVEITIPNSVIANSKIVNESGGPWEKERLRIKVGVAYGTDVDRVREVLGEVAQGEERVCEAPEPRVRFRAFGESSLDFELLVWIDEPVLRGQTQDALLTAIYKRFQTEGIEIPYPKRDVYVRELPVRRDVEAS
jgi:small-conductance mechanosensitive channel